MEVFRYWTASRMEEARRLGKIKSHHPVTFRRYPQHIFVFPNDPLVWGTELTIQTIDNIRRNHARRPDVLILFRLTISSENPNIFIRDLYGDIPNPWLPLASNPPSLFQYPEIIIPTPIPIEHITQIPIPPTLKPYSFFPER